MKVAFFTDSFYPSVNGVVSSIVNFAGGLVKLGHEVLIFAPEDTSCDQRKESGLHPKVKLVLLPSVDGRVHRGLRVGWPKWEVWKELKEFQPDVIHTHSPLLLGISGLVLGRRMGVPVLTTHGTKFDHEDLLKLLGRFKVPFVEVVHKRGVKGLTKSFLSLHDGIVVSTKDTEDGVVEMGVKKPIYRVFIPVPVKELQNSWKRGLARREELQIEKALIFVGRLSAEKNIDLTIDVFAKLMKRHKKLKLVLVGDGDSTKRLFDYAAKNRVLEKIVWMGEVDHGELMSGGHYYLGDVFITLSRFETQGLSTVEAMACGLVPVVVEGTASEEIVGGAGLVVGYGEAEKIADKLDKLMAGDMEDLSRKAKQRASEFGIVVCSRRLVKIYEHAIQERM